MAASFDNTTSFYLTAFSLDAFAFDLPHVSPSFDAEAFDAVAAFSTSAFDFEEATVLDTSLRYVRTTRRKRSF